VKEATLHRSDFVQQNATNTKTNNSDLQDQMLKFMSKMDQIIDSESDGELSL
jgi:hypothetical protein